MQEQMEKLYILCGLSSEASDDICGVLQETARAKGFETVCVSRYRKEGIRQYVSEHPEFRLLVLQEAMQSSYPYTAEELAELMDDYNLNIVISLRKSHRANTYMKVLYTAGILNALYEEDATAENIMERILYPRTRRECREYYQISTAADAMRSLEIVDEDRMKGYLSYVEETKDEEEIIKKYHYVANSLKIIENIYLVEHFSERVKDTLGSDEMYRQVTGVKEKKRRHWPFKKNQELPPNLKVLRQPEKEIYPRAPSAAKEKEIPRAKEHEVADMIDEDISDLLGFSADEKDFPTGVLEALPKEEDAEEKGAFSKAEKRRLPFRAIAFGIALVFLATVILFGFFLYSEHQSKETGIPVISRYSEESGKKDMKAAGTDEAGHAADQAVKKRERQEKKQDTKTADRNLKDITTEKTDKGHETQEQTAQTAAAGRSGQVPVSTETYNPVQDQQVVSALQAAAGEGQTYSVDIAENGQPSVPAQQEPPAVSYQGKIVTGAEAIRIAYAKEAEGVSLYLQTREDGEGIFCADVIAQMVDGTCSYLIQESGTEQISFIQQ